MVSSRIKCDKCRRVQDNNSFSVKSGRFADSLTGNVTAYNYLNSICISCENEQSFVFSNVLIDLPTRVDLFKGSYKYFDCSEAEMMDDVNYIERISKLTLDDISKEELYSIYLH